MKNQVEPLQEDNWIGQSTNNPAEYVQSQAPVKHDLRPKEIHGSVNLNDYSVPMVGLERREANIALLLNGLFLLFGIVIGYCL